MNAARLAYFERLYGSSDDPYALRTRWYERRKRALLLACLPQENYRMAYEPGCGSGDLTVALAARCGQVLASDFSDGAVAAARRRTQGLANVRVARHALPQDWPVSEGPFDLIVLSELGYFLDAHAMHALAAQCLASLADDGALVACDWRPPFAERALATDAVHLALASLGLPRLLRLLRHEEDDFLLELWSRDARSVARREGIR